MKGLEMIWFLTRLTEVAAGIIKSGLRLVSFFLQRPRPLPVIGEWGKSEEV